MVLVEKERKKWEEVVSATGQKRVRVRVGVMQKKVRHKLFMAARSKIGYVTHHVSYEDKITLP